MEIDLHVEFDVEFEYRWRLLGVCSPVAAEHLRSVVVAAVIVSAVIVRISAGFSFLQHG